MLFSRHPSTARGFYSVALALILVGSGFLAVGVVEWIGSMLWDWQFGWPLAKVLGGLIILALGYILLELELMRNKE